MNPWLFLAGVNGILAVAAGAYGWHWLETHDSATRDVFNLGVQYHMWHALALLGAAWVKERRPVGAWGPRIAGLGFSLGILLFSGTLYVFGLTGNLPVPGAAPTGGFLLMVGWGALAWEARGWWGGRGSARF